VPTVIAGFLKFPRVHEVMHPPQKRNNSWIIRLDLSGDFEGPARFVIKDMGGGYVELSGLFDGVQSNTVLFTKTALAEKHLAAESGTLSFPFPSGTGWVGLIDGLENGRWVQ
jgi:hypothetical protein